MNTFDFTDYKQVIKNLITQNKKHKPNLTFESLANYCRIQKTYLSKVLNKEGHLSLDQFYLAAQFIKNQLKLTDSQIEFIELLYLYDLTDIQERKQSLLKKIEKAKTDSSKTEKMIAINQVAISNQIKEEYHLDPFYSIIHMFLTIEKYSVDVNKISESLNLDKFKVLSYLNKMIEWGIVQFENKKYKVIHDDLHLSKDSNIYMTYRNLMNSAAQHKMNSLLDEDFYSFSVVYTCDKKVNDKIKQRFFAFLKDIQQDVKKAKAEDVYQMNFNLLKWS